MYVMNVTMVYRLRENHSTEVAGQKYHNYIEINILLAYVFSVQFEQKKSHCICMGVFSCKMKLQNYLLMRQQHLSEASAM